MEVKLRFILVFCLVAIPSDDVRGYSWFCVQELFLVVLRKPSMMPGIEPQFCRVQGKRHTHCKKYHWPPNEVVKYYVGRTQLENFIRVLILFVNLEFSIMWYG